MVRIGVVGDGIGSATTNELAYQVGRLLGENGATLVCGGLRGVMESASRGARECGGRTVGILPGISAADANPYIETAVVTGMGEGRNVLVVRNSQCLIAVGGGFGTLSEIALGLKSGVPVVGLDTWSISRPESAGDPIVRAATPREAVDIALGLARQGS